MKQVRYLYARTGKNPDLHFVEPRDYVSLNNPLDETALEKAVQIKESLGTGEIWTLSVGETFLESEARRCLALGADRFVRINDSAWGQLDAWATGLALSRAVKKISANVVLCGTRSLDLGRSQVGCYLASHLGYPYVSSAVGIEHSSDHQLWTVRRSLGRGSLEELECRLQLVIGVEKSLCEPRYPSRSAVLRAAKQDIVLWGGSDLGLDVSDMVPRVCEGSLRSPRPRPKWLPIPDSSWPARERIRFLLSRDVQEKRGEVVKEEPEKLVQRLVKFLRDNDLISEETPDTPEQASDSSDGTGKDFP